MSYLWIGGGGESRRGGFPGGDKLEPPPPGRHILSNVPPELHLLQSQARVRHPPTYPDLSLQREDLASVPKHNPGRHHDHAADEPAAQATGSRADSAPGSRGLHLAVAERRGAQALGARMEEPLRVPSAAGVAARGPPTLLGLHFQPSGKPHICGV